MLPGAPDIWHETQASPVVCFLPVANGANHKLLIQSICSICIYEDMCSQGGTSNRDEKKKSWSLLALSSSLPSAIATVHVRILLHSGMCLTWSVFTNNRTVFMLLHCCCLSHTSTTVRMLVTVISVNCGWKLHHQSKLVACGLNKVISSHFWYRGVSTTCKCCSGPSGGGYTPSGNYAGDAEVPDFEPDLKRQRN